MHFLILDLLNGVKSRVLKTNRTDCTVNGFPTQYGRDKWRNFSLGRYRKTIAFGNNIAHTMIVRSAVDAATVWSLNSFSLRIYTTRVRLGPGESRNRKEPIIHYIVVVVIKWHRILRCSRGLASAKEKSEATARSIN